MKIHSIFVFAICLLVVAFSVSAFASEDVSPSWTSQFGTYGLDAGWGVSVDGSGNFYVSGTTESSLNGLNNGATDAFLRKYTPSGTVAWTQQLGTTSQDLGNDVTTDSNGNVYIAGSTRGVLNGSSAGDGDAFVTKYNASGSLLWTRQVGTSGYDAANSVAVDALGNVYITGFQGSENANAFVTKYDASGTFAWTRTMETASTEVGNGVSIDGSNNIYVTGSTTGGLEGANQGGYDTFIRKYTPDGVPVWTKQPGTSGNDESWDIGTDASGIYITGSTKGDLDGTNKGNYDAFVTKYNFDGSHAWTRQLGTILNDIGNSLSIDPVGNVYIAGDTGGEMDGASLGLQDIFAAKFNATGELLWTEQFGTDAFDSGLGISALDEDNIFITGFNRVEHSGTTITSLDAFVTNVSPVPEPSSLLMLILGGIPLLMAQRRRK